LEFGIPQALFILGIALLIFGPRNLGGEALPKKGETKRSKS
jgi:Sec-independent protein translocase protein TatA